MSETMTVPHLARRSFDYATCICGWHWSDDNPQRLQDWVDAHNEAYAGHLVTVEVFTP